MCRLSGSSGTIKIKCKDLQVLHLDIPGMEQCLNIAHSIEVYQQTRFCSDFLRFIRLFTFTSLCPDPVRLGHCVGDVPFLLQTLWRQPAGPVGSLVPRKLLQPNEGTCKQLINYVYVHGLMGKLSQHWSDTHRGGRCHGNQTCASEVRISLLLSFHLFFPFAEWPTLCLLFVFKTHTFLWE